MIDSHLAVQAPPEVIQSARNALKEMEQEFIMLRFKFGAPTGEYKNEIKNVPGINVLPVNSTRDTMFMNNLKHEMSGLRNLLAREDSYITIKRLKVFRQRYIGMVHNNQNASKSRSTSMWNIKSSKFLAGKFLADIMNRHIPCSIVPATY